MTASLNPVRKASRTVRRQQLIDSTIAVLARRGFAALTVAEVAKEAGLSPGIVIFHFNSKDELLAAALRFLVAEYRAHWEARMNEAGPAAADRLRALLLADFETDVFTQEKLAAWIAFWGETQGRPVYDEICSVFEAERLAATVDLCQAIEAEGGYGLNPQVIARSLEALGDGLWLGLAARKGVHESLVAAAEARRIIAGTLGAFFPRHYGRPAA